MSELSHTHDFDDVWGGLRVRGGTLTGGSSAGYVATGLKNVRIATVTNQSSGQVASPQVIRNSDNGTENHQMGTIYVAAVNTKVYRWLALGY